MAKAKNIIIIEDNETFSLLVTHYLKNNLGNVQVYVENSGARAIESIKRLKPTIVILDYYLENDLSAKDVMRVINSMDVRPSVVLLSSIKDQAEQDEVMEMGIEKFVPKSNESLYDLIQVIETILSRDQSYGNSGKSRLSISAIIGLISLIIFFLLALYLFIQKG
jgi:DNA-binding NarL/FixJ family response regulator